MKTLLTLILLTNISNAIAFSNMQEAIAYHKEQCDNAKKVNDDKKQQLECGKFKTLSAAYSLMLTNDYTSAQSQTSL
ncbi:hypothetical protein [Fastidiosibacter lacustris]|uniref:hypothetical protein n=1 Tax=Fastidiosibacter lacustris TaxID=2056695 RepID=UPI001300B148|nr:hypothetical protein [Fastidiosibacter lacustris]